MNSLRYLLIKMASGSQYLVATVATNSLSDMMVYFSRVEWTNSKQDQSWVMTGEGDGRRWTPLLGSLTLHSPLIESIIEYPYDRAVEMGAGVDDEDIAALFEIPDAPPEWMMGDQNGEPTE
jgi:hypothetical protein